MRRKELLPVGLEGAEELEHWARPDALDAAFEPQEIVHILNPFDPLVIQRKRLRLFFDYDHRFEAYVPKHKRLFGYFTHPVLAGNDIVAVLDLKADRERQKLLMQKWTWLGKGPRRAAQAADRGRAAPLRALSVPALKHIVMMVAHALNRANPTHSRIGFASVRCR